MENQQSKLLDRVQLYEQVWSKPMIKLAADYGLSDNGLRKICKKLKVPVPKVGYWQKIQHSRTVSRVPLPDFNGKADVEIKPTEKKIPYNNLPPEIVSEFLPENKIKVNDVLDKPHFLIQSLKKSLNRKERHLNKGMVIGQRGELSVHVSPESIDRALRIFDALIKGLEKRSRKVFVDTKEEYKCPTFVSWENEIINISLFETHRVVKKEVKTNSWEGNWDYIPTGILILRIGNDYWNTRNQWKDGKKKKLEDQLNDFIVGLYDEYKERKDRKLYWEQKKREDQEKSRQQEELREKQEIEHKKIQKLEQDALNWQRSQIITSYLEASKKAYIEKNGEIKSGSDYEQWINWANKQANSLDPLMREA